MELCNLVREIDAQFFPSQKRQLKNVCITTSQKMDIERELGRELPHGQNITWEDWQCYRIALCTGTPLPSSSEDQKRFETYLRDKA